MRMNQYPSVEYIEDEDIFVVETGGGTKKATAEDLAEYLKVGEEDTKVETLDPVAYHRDTYRGKNLGSTFTDEQKNAVKLGTFEDLFVGDYWESNGIKYRIADIDYHMGTKVGSSGTDYVKDHHLIILPDRYIYTAPLTSVSGGYAGTNVRKNIKNAVPYFSAIFGTNNFITDMQLRETTSSNNYTVAVVTQETGIILMHTSQVFGSMPVMNDNATVSSGQYYVSATLTPFKLFSLKRNFMFNDSDPDGNINYWLQNLTPGSRALVVTDTRVLSGTGLTNNFGVRPYAIIKG